MALLELEPAATRTWIVPSFKNKARPHPGRAPPTPLFLPLFSYSLLLTPYSLFPLLLLLPPMSLDNLLRQVRWHILVVIQLH